MNFFWVKVNYTQSFQLQLLLVTENITGRHCTLDGRYELMKTFLSDIPYTELTAVVSLDKLPVSRVGLF